jgi:hypothetical protein
MKYTTESFIEKSKNHPKHFGKYLYEKTEFISRIEKVCITCSVHGDFWQTPKSHLTGSGCTICKNQATRTRCLFDKKKFIEQANIAHNYKYSYNTAIYIDSHTDIVITCPLHGNFLQKPYSHIAGIGCALCGFNSASLKRRKCLNQFILDSKSKHIFAKYDYSQAEYSTSKTKICIICPTHGKFWQTPNKHLRGCGCPKCRESIAETQIRSWLENKKVLYEKEYRISNCKNIFSLPFDFAIFQNGSLHGLIEYQGVQHYKPIKRSKNWSDEKTNNKFLEMKQRDKIKKDYCKSQKIPLLTIPYTDKEKIPTLLEKFIE